MPRFTLGRVAAGLSLVVVVVAALFATSNVSPASAEASLNGYFVFDKNPSNPQDSLLTWYVYDVSRPQGPVLVEKASWRAGSGKGPDNKDSCVRDNGWLPNGKYAGSLKMNYDGSKIKGIVFALDDTKCSDGTPRTELFIHSEMTKTHGQTGCAAKGDSPWCWESVDDYESAGCIKLTPKHMAEAAAMFKKHYVANHKYSELLYVRS